MSATLDLPDARLGARPAQRRLGARAPRHHEPAAPGPPVGRAATAARRARCTTRSSPCAAPTTTEADGEAIGFSLVYSGNFLAEAEVDPFGTTRVRIGIEPETFGWTLEPGAALHHARRRSSSTRRPGSAAMSDAFHRLYPRAARPRDLARPRRGRSSSTTGRRPTSTSTRTEARRRSRASARDLGVELFVLDDGWFGERDDGRLVARRLVRRPAQAARRARRARRQRIEALGLGFGIWIEPEMVSQRSRAVRGPPGLGDRHPRPAADREPPAARPRPVAARGRRPPRSASCPRSSRARRSPTSSGT